MELKLEVLSTVSIKRKKPWPRIAWLLEREPPLSLYLLDGSRISQLSLRTGKTRRKFPTLSQVQSQLALTSASPGGSYLGGLTINGDFFLWNKMSDVLETFVSPLSRMGGEKDKPSAQQFKNHCLFISESGEQALLVANKNEIYLWELKEEGRTFWWKLIPPSDIEMPETSSREIAMDACFYVHPVLGECCSCVFVFTSRDSPHHVTTITHLLISWPNSTVQFYSDHSHKPETVQYAFPFGGHSSENQSELDPLLSATSQQENQSASHVTTKDNALEIEVPKGQSSSEHEDQGSNSGYAPPLRNSNNAPPFRDRTNLKAPSDDHISAVPIQSRTHFSALIDGPPPFQTSWATLSHSPTCTPEDKVSSSTHTGRGSYVCKISPSGSVVALCINEKEACDSHMTFFSPLASVGVTNSIYPLREYNSRRGRTYWVADMAWTHDELFLVCMTRRGCLLVLPRFGPPLKLVTLGDSSLEMRPTMFLPLHPLITVSGASKAITDHETSQSSERDPLRQRFSVSTHPRLSIFLCSDGYSLTVLKFPFKEPPSPLLTLVNGLVQDAREKLGLPFTSVPIAAETSGEDDIEDACSSEKHLDLAATIGGSDFGSTLASTLSSNVGGGFLSGLSGVEAGVIHFAGIGSDLECTQSSIGGQTITKMPTVLSAMTQIQAAFGLLLSSSVVDPIALNNKQTAADSLPGGFGGNATFKQTVNLLANTISTTISRLNVSAGSDEMLQDTSQLVPLLYGMIDTLFGLVSLDSLNQCHQEVVITVVNGIFKALLVKLLTKHSEFVAIKKQHHTLQSLKEYTTIISEEVTRVSDLLNQLVSVLTSTYSLREVSTEVLPGVYAPSLSVQNLHQRRQLPDNLALQLTPLLMVLLEVVTSFWKDLKACSDLSKNASSSKHDHPSRFQVRELGLLCKSLASSMHSALVALQYAHTQICGLLRLEYAGIAELSREKLAQQSSTANNVVGSSNTLVKSKNGNPITSISRDVSSHRCSNISVLFTYLEKYDLKSALQYAHSFISAQDTSTDTPHRADHKSTTEKHHRSNHRAHSVEPSPPPNITAANTGTGTSFLNRSKSWTAHSSSRSTQVLSFAGETSFILHKQGREVVAITAQLMKAYFTNKKLLVPTSSYGQSFNVGRFLELSRSKFASAIREQKLSEIWTVDHTLELLLLADLWAPACEFVTNLGDWRKAVLLASAYLCYSKQLSDVLRNKPVENQLRKMVEDLALEDILKLLNLQAELNLGSSISLEIAQSISSTFMVCSVSHLDGVLTSVAVSLLQELRECCKSLALEVPSCVYLPAPPLYCPQPSVLKEELIQSPKEYNLRRKISNLVRNLTLILRSSNTLHPCAHWYTTKLKQCVMSHREATETLRLPEGDEFSEPVPTSTESAVKFNDDPSKLSPAVRTLLTLFREFCGLQWFLHVRDQASFYLQKLKPKIHKPQTPPEEVRQAAMWCARLLPFTKFLSQNGGLIYSHTVQDVVLSTLMELPVDVFLTEMLSYCFPESAFDASYLEAKMKRLLSRLRSSPDLHQTSISASDRHFPLSVRYQTRSQKVLAQREDTFNGDIGGLFISLIDTSSDSTTTEVKLKAVKVGSCLFEWDTGYHNFLDTFLSVILPNELTSVHPSSMSPSMLDPLYLHSPMLPHLSEFTNKETDSETKSEQDCSSSWHKMLPLFDFLTRWSQTSTPQLVQQELTVKAKHGQRKKEASTEPVAPVMRVKVSIPFIANCLKQREMNIHDDVHVGNGKTEARKQDQKALDPSRHISAQPSTASVPQPSKLPVHATPSAPRESVPPSDEDHSRSLHVDDLNQSSHPQTTSNDKDEVDLAPLHASSHKGPLLLLEVPKGVLKGHLPPEVGQSLLTSSKTARGGTAKRTSYSPDEDDNSALDVVLTESFSSSTGEVPTTALTFSIGEVVHGQTKLGDATMTGELDTLSSISDQLPRIRQQTNHYHNSATKRTAGQSTEKQGSENSSKHKEKKGTSSLPKGNSSSSKTEGDIRSHPCNGGAGGMGDGNGGSDSDHSGSKSDSDTEHENDEDSSTVVVTSSTLSEVSQVLSDEGDSHNTTIQAEEMDNKQATDEAKNASRNLECVTAKDSNQTNSQERSEDVPGVGDGSKDSIRDIVRTEMAKVLQHQHQQLLSVLTNKSTRRRKRQQTTANKTQPLTVCDLEATPEVVPTTTQQSSSEKSEGSIAPVLNVEDLKSPTDTVLTGQLSHFTVSLSPVKPVSGTHQQPKTLHHHGGSPTHHRQGPHTRTPHQRDAVTQTVNPVKSTITSHKLDQTKSHSRVDNITLLHIDDLHEPAATTGVARRHPSSLEEEFPGVAQALNKFNKTVAPVTLNVGTPHIPAQLNEGVSGKGMGMPLLKLPKEEDTLPGMVPPMLGQGLPAQQKPTVTSAMPLLTLPPEMLANQPPSLHRTHAHTSHSYHPPLHTPQPPVTIKLPQVPIQQFVPKLIPPNVIWPKTTGAADKRIDKPVLLKLDDPLTKMKENGLQLLQLPKEFQMQETAPQLLSIPPPERRYPHSGHSRGLKTRRKSGRDDESLFDSTTSSFEVSSESYGQAVTLDDGKMDKKSKGKKRSKHGRHVTWKRESSIEPRNVVTANNVQSPVTSTRMSPEAAAPVQQHQHSVSTSTLKDQSDSRSQSPQKQSTIKVDTVTPEDHHTSTRLPENADTSGTLQKQEEEDTAIIQPLSGFTHPDKVPYKSLEQRRLEMNNSPSLSPVPMKSNSPSIMSPSENKDHTTPTPSRSSSTSPSIPQNQTFTKTVSIETADDVNTEVTRTVAMSQTKSVDFGVQVDTPLSAELADSSGLQIEHPHDSLGDTGSTYVVESPVLNVGQALGDADTQDGRHGDDDVCGTGMESEHVSESGSTSSESNPTLPACSSHVLPSQLPEDVTVQPSPVESESTEVPISIPKDFVGFNASPPPPLYFNAVDQEGMTTATDNHKGKVSDLVKMDVFEKLQLLEEQLNAIESTARTVEGEFQSTNQILQTIEQLQTVSETLDTSGRHDDSNVQPFPSEEVDHFDSVSTQPEVTVDTVDTRLTPLDSQLTQVDSRPKSFDTVNSKLRQTDTELISVDQVTIETDTDQLNIPTKEILTSSRRTKELPRKFEAWESSSSQNLKTQHVAMGTGTGKKGTGKTKHRKQQHVSFKKQQDQVGTVNGEPQFVGQEKGGRSKQLQDNTDKVREWMIAKRQERLAEFLNERKRLQEREKHPFEPPPSPKSKHSSKSVKRQQEKQFLTKRIDDAYALMNDMLSSNPFSKPSPSSSETMSNPSKKHNRTADRWEKNVHGPLTHLPPRSTTIYGVKSRRHKATQDDKKVIGNQSRGLDSTGKKKSSSDSNLFRYSAGDAVESNSTGGNSSNNRSTTRLSGTFTKALTSPKQQEYRLRKISSAEGLTEDEQDRIATILASTDYDAGSVSSGSVYSNIDWEEVDRILDT